MNRGRDLHRLEQACLDVHDRVIGLDLGTLWVHGCIVRAPCGGDAGISPIGRETLGTKRSLLVNAHGMPIGYVTAARTATTPGCWHTLEKLSRFGSRLPEQILCTSTPSDSKKTADAASSTPSSPLANALIVT